jgi:uncharacterized protein (DUF1501 family)
MERRKFFKYAGAGLVAPFLFKGQIIGALAGPTGLNLLGTFNPNRKLVLIQLNGGNDGLNMVIPISQYDNLANARRNILVQQTQILKLNDETGLHPVMTELTNLYKDGKVQIIQGVGYPNPNLSHFRSKDILLSASDSNEVITSGWMGRVFEKQYPNYPNGFPNVNQPHPIALSIGSTSSQSCQGDLANFSTVLKNLTSSYSSSSANGGLPDTPFGTELRYLINAMEQTESYLSVIKEAAAKAKNLSTLYPAAGQNALADQLKIVANLIAGGLKTQIYVVNFGAWDTHSLQITSETDKLTGAQPSLLSKLSQGINAFQDDLRLLGKADEVLGFAFTEFGRRIKSNDSLGTDHGTTWPAILFGSKINPGLIGSNPIIPSVVSKTDNLPLQNDFRSIYSGIYKQWFEVDNSTVTQILGKSFPEIKVVAGSTSVSPENNEATGKLTLWPNPVNEILNLSFNSEAGISQIAIYSMEGKLIKVLSERRLEQQNHTIQLSIGHLSSGHYNLVVQSKNQRLTSKFFVK